MTGKFQEPRNIFTVCCNRGPAIRTGIEFLTTCEQKRLAFGFNVERHPKVERSFREGRTGVFSWCAISWFNFPWNVNVRKLLFMIRGLKGLYDPRRTWIINRYSWLCHSIVLDFEIWVLRVVRVVYREQVDKREYVTCLLLMIRENKIFFTSVIGGPLFFSVCEQCQRLPPSPRIDPFQI